VNLGANMMRDQPDDAFPVGSGQAFVGFRQTLREPINPQPTVRIEHHLDDRGIFKVARDGWTECRAQHPRTA
jgi:hypothetical protein